MKYSKMAEDITPSAIRAMMVQTSHMDDVIPLSVGEPDFLTEPAVLEAAKDAMEKSTKYAPGAGFDVLRETYAGYLNETIGTDYSKDEVIVTNGGMAALYLTLLCLLNQGDEVLLCAPYFTNYEGMVRMAGGVPILIEVKEEDDFVLDPSLFEMYITPRTKVLLLNSPCNPTGAVIGRKDLEQIARIACRHNLFVISDEVYRHLIYDGEEIVSIASMSGMKDRCVVVDSVSKSFAMTGFRVGFAAGPQHLIALMAKLTENLYSCVSSVSQYAALAAIRNGAAYRDYMIGEYSKRRNYVMRRIGAMQLISCIRPKGAFYVFVNISKTGLRAEEFSQRLLLEKHVAVVPGTNFGSNAADYVRISYSISMENLQKAMDRLEEFIRQVDQDNRKDAGLNK